MLIAQSKIARAEASILMRSHHDAENHAALSSKMEVGEVGGGIWSLMEAVVFLTTVKRRPGLLVKKRQGGSEQQRGGGEDKHDHKHKNDNVK